MEMQGTAGGRGSKPVAPLPGLINMKKTAKSVTRVGGDITRFLVVEKKNVNLPTNNEGSLGVVNIPSFGRYTNFIHR